eukprot:12259538-Ditylum_brightwellii.AAC.1
MEDGGESTFELAMTAKVPLAIGRINGTEINHSFIPNYLSTPDIKEKNARIPVHLYSCCQLWKPHKEWFDWGGALLYPEFDIAAEIMLNVLDMYAMAQLSEDIV